MSDLNNPKMMNLTAASVLVGSLITLTGLHMKDREFGIWAEASGYIVLGTLSFYFIIVMTSLGPQAGLSRVGTATSMGYIMAMLQRTYQIIVYQIARFKVFKLEAEIQVEKEKLLE